MNLVDEILDRFARPTSIKAIALELGIDRRRVRALVVAAHWVGDPRAKRNARNHDSRGIYRSRSEAALLKEKVLDAWAAGELAKPIAMRLGINDDYVSAIERRARNAGDDRAVKRSRYVLPPGGGRSAGRLALSVAR